jgi:hypothetical protein
MIVDREAMHQTLADFLRFFKKETPVA